MIRKPLVIPDLPPLWDTPAPYRSTRNGGPPLEPRSAGRPTIDTPELRDRIFELLCDGMPLRAICRVDGMPARRTVYNWILVRGRWAQVIMILPEGNLAATAKLAIWRMAWRCHPERGPFSALTRPP